MGHGGLKRGGGRRGVYKEGSLGRGFSSRINWKNSIPGVYRTRGARFRR